MLPGIGTPSELGAEAQRARLAVAGRAEKGELRGQVEARGGSGGAGGCAEARPPTPSASTTTRAATRRRRVGLVRDSVPPTLSDLELDPVSTASSSDMVSPPPISCVLVILCPDPPARRVRPRPKSTLLSRHVVNDPRDTRPATQYLAHTNFQVQGGLRQEFRCVRGRCKSHSSVDELERRTQVRPQVFANLRWIAGRATLDLMARESFISTLPFV